LPIDKGFGKWYNLGTVKEGGKKVMVIYVIVGGCVTDEHIIAIYKNKAKADNRADKENKECQGLGAYVEEWQIEK